MGIILDRERVIEFIRATLAKQLSPVTEKSMFHSLCFMVDDKMCLCAKHDHLLCRIGIEQVAAEIEKGNGRQMIMKGRPMKDFIFVNFEWIESKAELLYWIRLCLKFNPIAKSSKKIKF